MYVTRIELVLKNANNPYAINSIWCVCRDILQHEELSFEEEIKINEFKDEFGKMRLDEIYQFRELGMELLRYVYNDLGLD